MQPYGYFVRGPFSEQTVRKFPLLRSCNFNYPSIPGKMTGLDMHSCLRGYLQKFVQAGLKCDS